MDEDENIEGHGPRTWGEIQDSEDEDVTTPKPFGTIQDVAERKTLSEIGVRTRLAYAVVGVFLVCMLIYVINRVYAGDAEGLTNAISILVGIVGLVMGYFFGTEEGQDKG